MLSVGLSPIGINENFLYQLHLDTKETRAFPIDLQMAHSIYRAHPDTDRGYIIEQNGRKIWEISLKTFLKIRAFTMPPQQILYGHASYHQEQNSLLLPTSSLNKKSPDTLVSLNLDSWSLTRTYNLGTYGRLPHDIVSLKGKDLALVIARGKLDKHGRRTGGPIILIDLKKNRALRTWDIDGSLGHPAHFSPWIDENESIYFSMLDTQYAAPPENRSVLNIRNGQDG